MRQKATVYAAGNWEELGNLIHKDDIKVDIFVSHISLYQR